MSEHRHIWHLKMHLDGCHTYESFYSCACGASRNVGAERDFTGDEAGMSMAMWALEEDCQRCRELLEGAEPKSWDEIVPLVKA